MVTSNRQTEMIDRWCEQFVATCREREIRVTDQRLAVYRALAEDTSHPTAESLYGKVQERLPSMSLATLYRTLEFLERERLIKRVSAPDTVGRFDANLDPHQHLVCRGCGKLADLHLEEFVQSIPNFKDFTVEEMDIRYVGLCSECSGKS